MAKETKDAVEAQEEIQEEQSFYMPDLGDTPDRVNAEGQHTLVVKSIKNKTSKKNPENHYLLVYFGVASMPEANPVSHMLMIPNSNYDEDVQMGWRQDLKEFWQLLEQDPSGHINFDECVGLTVEAILKIDSDEEYGEQSKVAKFVK